MLSIRGVICYAVPIQCNEDKKPQPKKPSKVTKTTTKPKPKKSTSKAPKRKQPSRNLPTKKPKVTL